MYLSTAFPSFSPFFASFIIVPPAPEKSLFHRRHFSQGMANSIAQMLTGRAYSRSMSAVCISFTTGDLICQSIEAGSVSSEKKLGRTAQFAAVGGCILGPASHTLEFLLERFIPGTSALPIAKKVAARVIVSPLFLSLNFGSLALLRGQDAIAAIRTRVLPAWQTGCLFWPFVAALTYRYVPLPARPATGAAVGVVWGSFLSWVAHRRLPEP